VGLASAQRRKAALGEVVLQLTQVSVTESQIVSEIGGIEPVLRLYGGDVAEVELL
jgi:hypothetical protein